MRETERKRKYLRVKNALKKMKGMTFQDLRIEAATLILEIDKKLKELDKYLL
jgi:hypothetical protein